MRTLRTLVALGGSGLVMVSALAADPYIREIERARAERVERLTAPDGWLTLIGLHFLKTGVSEVGSASGNDVVLAAGPARVGRVTLADDGTMRFTTEPAADVLVDGAKVSTVRLTPEGGTAKPTLVTAGTMSFFVIDRGGKKALRVRDSESPRRRGFLGIEYFPIDPEWRIEARWVQFERSRQIRITNMLGQTSPAFVPGAAVFEREGKRFELLPIDEGPGHPLFFVISDATSGKETYDAARFLYADRPREGAQTIVLDFNRTQNPPCAFTPFATCPLPPKENRLPFAVNAGERAYRGGHE